MVFFTCMAEEKGVTLVVATHDWGRVEEGGFHPVKFHLEQDTTGGTVRATVSG